MYCIFVFDIYPAYSLSFLNLSWHITLTWANVQSLSFQICPLLLSFLSFPQCIHSTFCSCPKSLDTLFCFVPSSFSWFCFFEDCSSVFACCLLQPFIALSILIILVLNSQSDNSSICAMSGSDVSSVSSNCVYYFLVWLVISQPDMMNP